MEVEWACSCLNQPEVIAVICVSVLKLDFWMKTISSKQAIIRQTYSTSSCGGKGLGNQVVITCVNPILSGICHSIISVDNSIGIESIWYVKIYAIDSNCPCSQIGCNPMSWIGIVGSIIASTTIEYVIILVTIESVVAIVAVEDIITQPPVKLIVS